MDIISKDDCICLLGPLQRIAGRDGPLIAVKMPGIDGCASGESTSTRIGRLFFDSSVEYMQLLPAACGDWECHRRVRPAILHGDYVRYCHLSSGMRKSELA